MTYDMTGPQVAITYETFDDAANVRADEMIAQMMERIARPWLFPDRNPMPLIDLFPRVTKTIAWTTRQRARLEAGLHGLRYGPCDCYY